MKVVVLYHPQSDHSRAVEEFAHDYQRFHGQALELMSLDTVEGSSMARLYDITSYPAVVARRDSGELLQMWIGEPLPLMNEVAAYFNS